jgi:predicted acetyltransferase
MNIEIRKASIDDQTTFRNLFQFYLYEFSRFLGWPVTNGGRFIEDDLEGCWTQDHRHPFLFRVDGSWAGLAIVDENTESRYTGATNVTSMSEFFIMAAYRRQGVGRKAATTLFDRFPGTWEVFELGLNIDAPKFWRPTINTYTGGNYREIDSKEYKGVVQLFTTH